MDVIVWLVCGVTAIVASVLAARSRRAMIVGRVAVGALMLVGGAVVNAAYLWFGLRDYTAFADPAHFRWVTDAWRAVVAPNQALFINLLIAFEAVVGILILSGGRRTQLGLVGAIGFHAALWLFGWIETVYVLVMLPPLVLLLLAERRAAKASAPGGRPRKRVPAGPPMPT
ncbi:MAG: hypothetical protein ACXVYC_10985 [Blastococcus sp.]